MTVSDLTEKDLTGANNDEVGDIERVVESTADKKQHLGACPSKALDGAVAE